MFFCFYKSGLWCIVYQSDIEVSDVYPWMNFNQVANLHIRVVSDWQCPITIKPLPNWEAFNSLNIMMPNRKVSSTSFAIEFVLSMCVLKLRTFYDRDLWQVMLVPNWFNSIDISHSVEIVRIDPCWETGTYIIIYRTRLVFCHTGNHEQELPRGDGEYNYWCKLMTHVG